MSVPTPIPVVCDRCRAEGFSHEDPFARFGALLDFGPVPRRTARADGWDAEVQRAFIAALSLTGSVRAAARAVGKAAFGAEQLRRVPGNEEFLAAWDEALAVAADERSRRLAEGLAAVAAEQAGARRPQPAPWAEAASRRPAAAAGRLPPPAIDPESITDEQEQAAMDLLGDLIVKYIHKLEAERRCRLEGRIAEADFYVRQITVFEVAMEALHGNPMELLKQARIGGYDLLHVASTPITDILDKARRLHWTNAGEPERPEYPPAHLLQHHDGLTTENMDVCWSDDGRSMKEQQRAQEAQYARDAQAQIEWEVKAREQAAQWRARAGRDDNRRRESDAGSSA